MRALGIGQKFFSRFINPAQKEIPINQTRKVSSEFSNKSFTIDKKEIKEENIRNKIISVLDSLKESGLINNLTLLKTLNLSNSSQNPLVLERLQEDGSISDSFLRSTENHEVLDSIWNSETISIESIHKFIKTSKKELSIKSNKKENFTQIFLLMSELFGELTSHKDYSSVRNQELQYKYLARYIANNLTRGFSEQIEKGKEYIDFINYLYSRLPPEKQKKYTKMQRIVNDGPKLIGKKNNGKTSNSFLTT